MRSDNVMGLVVPHLKASESCLYIEYDRTITSASLENAEIVLENEDELEEISLTSSRKTTVLGDVLLDQSNQQSHLSWCNNNESLQTATVTAASIQSNICTS